MNNESGNGEYGQAVRRLAERICGVQEPGGEGDWMAYRDHAEAVLDEFYRGLAFAPEGFDKAVGVLFDTPADPKFKAGQPVWVAQFGSNGTT